VRTLTLSLFLLTTFTSFAHAQDSVSLAPYLSVRGAGAPALSPDGKSVVFGMSTSGTSQLWKVPAHATPDGSQYWPDQLTFFDDPIGGAEWSPDGKWLLFRKDQNGDERQQLYLIRPNGADLDSLTTNHKAIYGGRFAPDGRSIVYVSNERNEAFFDIYKLDLATRKRTLLHQSDHQNGLIGISPDNRWLFFDRDSGNANSYVYVLDLKRDQPFDEPRLLTPHMGDAIYNGFTISPDSKTLYFFTNEGREFMSRASLKFQDPNAHIVYRDNVSHDVDQDVFSRDGTLEVVTRNVDGVSTISVYDARSGKELAPPKLPENGFINNLQVSADGAVIAFNYTSATEIGGIYVYNRLTHKTERVTRPTFAGLDPKSFVSARLIHYPSFDGARIPAYYYHPAGATRAPVIVFMHGGPEDQVRPWFNSLAQYYVQRGYAMLIPNVRGSTGFGKTYAAADNTTNRMTSVRDMEYANRWLRAQPDVDTSRLVIFGGSYGGFMSLAAMTMQPDLWSAGVDLYGIANFHSFLKNTGAWRARNRMAEYGDPAKDSLFLYQISPINHVSDIKKPLFVYQGANDPRVPQSEAEQIVAAVRQKGIPVEYILLPDEGHGISKRENRIRVYTAIVDFLDRTLTRK
jgi:dipeptidyl aminopeptidase/acylaminoacyl peptidase